MRERRRGRGLRLALAGLAMLWSAGPILLVVVASVRPADQIFESPPSLWFTPTLDHYRALWETSPAFFQALGNSLIVAFGSVLLTVAVCTAAGYAYARHAGRWLQGSALGLLVARMLPPIIVTVPLFPIVNALALNDTHVLLILLYAAFYVSLGTWIMRAFVARIPRELDEAAQLDGAGAVTILLRVVLPLAAQGAVAVSVFTAVFAWNEYLFALTFTTTAARTAPVVIGEMLGTVEGVQWGVIFAAATIQLVPILALVLALQRFVVGGLTAGAVKG